MNEADEGVEVWVPWVLVLTILGAVLIAVSLQYPANKEEVDGPAVMFVAGLMSISIAIALTVLGLLAGRTARNGTVKGSWWEAYKWRMEASLGRCVEMDLSSSLPRGWIPVEQCFRFARMGLRGGVFGSIVCVVWPLIIGVPWGLVTVPVLALTVPWSVMGWVRYKQLKRYRKAICKRYPLDYERAEEVVRAYHDAEEVLVVDSVGVKNKMKTFPHRFTVEMDLDGRRWAVQLRSTVDSTETSVMVWPYEEWLEGYVEGIDVALRGEG